MTTADKSDSKKEKQKTEGEQSRLEAKRRSNKQQAERARERDDSCGAAKPHKEDGDQTGPGGSPMLRNR